jgi:hypothetical protein
MPLVSAVDYTTKRIYLSVETANTDIDLLDVYREVRVLRRTNNAHRNFKPIIEAGGNITKITGTSYTPAYVVLRYGCRVVPYNSPHKLRLIRDTFTDDGFAGRDCFDRTSLTYSVDIDVDFPEREIREVSVGGSTLSAADIWQYSSRTLTAGGGGGGGATAAEIWQYVSRTLSSIDVNAIATAVYNVLEPKFAEIATVNAIAAAVEARLTDEFGAISPNTVALAVQTLLATDLLKIHELHQKEALDPMKPVAYTNTQISSVDLNLSVTESNGTVVVQRI